MLNDESPEIVAMLGKQLGLLACMCGNTLSRPPHRKPIVPEDFEQEGNLACHHTELDSVPAGAFQDLLEQINLRCCVCDQSLAPAGQAEEGPSASKKRRLAIDDDKEGSGDEAKTAERSSIAPWAPFLAFLQSQSADEGQRVEFARSLRRIVAHMPADELVENGPASLKGCLRLVFDPAYHIRLAIGEALPHFVGERGLSSVLDANANAPATLEKLIADLKAAVDDESDTNSLQETSLIALGSLCTVLQGRFLVEVILSLLGKLAHPNLGLRALVHEQIGKVSASKQVPFAKLIEMHKHEIYPIIIESLLTAPELVEEMSGAIFDMDTQHLLHHALPFTLPRIVMQQSVALFKELARRLRVSVPQLLVPNFHHIFCYLLVEGTHKQLDESFRFFAQLMPQWSNPGILLKSCVNKLLDQLTLLLADPDKRPKVEAAFVTVSRLLPPQEGADDRVEIVGDSATTISNLLRPFFLGIMDYLSVLLHKGRSQSAQPDNDEMDRVLRSLSVLIRLIGPHLNNFRPKVMATLRLVLKFPHLVAPACDVFLDFITRLDVGQLGPILSQIVVDLLPYVASATPQVIRIFEYLIIDNKAALQPHFHKILFLPDLPPLARVRRELEDQQSKDFKDQLEQLLAEGINHESLDVQLLAVDKLQKVLAECRYASPTPDHHGYRAIYVFGALGRRCLLRLWPRL
ncbi:uncharacterized protein ACA1_170660 [Acanthamoeba castellanii str. Neff]|uniref:UME domain-containing protein n=1 Tax=Acanthamoeba castellanii (strain ATCC 30010 / Neff) TaxID=1257118 RepID=L8HGB6_ACACF|nr:uncharacterized protein ACA1_170660 [Acanthamoeba castellanii str. Neff]ELR24297.1 hypothetical protein ACA1_170660 [Acanthamoeba castellanii str. Neff]